MINWKISLIKKFLEMLLSGDIFATIELTVAELWNKDMTNDEKRAYVKAKVMPFISELGSFFLSTAIAFAVDSMRAELEKESKNG